MSQFEIKEFLFPLVHDRGYLSLYESFNATCLDGEAQSLMIDAIIFGKDENLPVMLLQLK